MLLIMLPDCWIGLSDFLRAKERRDEKLQISIGIGVAVCDTERDWRFKTKNPRGITDQ